MDDRGKTGAADRRQVAKSQQYEVSYLFADFNPDVSCDAMGITCRWR